MVTEGEVLNDFPRFAGILIAEFAVLAPKMKRDMIIKKLDLKPTINAMMRNFLDVDCLQPPLTGGLVVVNGGPVVVNGGLVAVSGSPPPATVVDRQSPSCSAPLTDGPPPLIDSRRRDGSTNWKVTRHHGIVAAVRGVSTRFRKSIQGSESQYEVQKISTRPAYIERYKDKSRFLGLLAKHYYEENRLREIIHPGLMNEMKVDSFDTYTMVSVMNSSNIIGSSADTDTVSEVTFDGDEEISGISGTVGTRDGYTIISSLSFKTTKRTHGPFGRQTKAMFSVLEYGRLSSNNMNDIEDVINTVLKEY
nr:mannose/glucose-specific lectin-like [Tanacetum cinerariifolium]